MIEIKAGFLKCYPYHFVGEKGIQAHDEYWLNIKSIQGIEYGRDANDFRFIVFDVDFDYDYHFALFDCIIPELLIALEEARNDQN